MKNKRLQILELICIFIITLIWSLVFTEPTNDDIWNYGFAYNIYSGLIPYRDFNMIITPLFPMIGSLLMRIIGSGFTTIYIYSAMIYTGIFWYMKKHNKYNYYIPYMILLVTVLNPNYNIACLLFIYMILDLENNNRNDYLIGIVLGLTFLTKQNIGIYLCIPTLFTKDIRKILKRVAGFMIPVVIFLIYLIANHTMYQFIDYCFLGIGDFGSNNIYISLIPIVFLGVGLIYLIYKYIKTRDYKVLYLICFFGMSYPIIDKFHVMIPFIITFDYFMSHFKLIRKALIISFIIVVAFVSTTNMYRYYTDDTIDYPNATHTYKYSKLDKQTVKNIEIMANKLKESDKNTFMIYSTGYLTKLEAGIPINKYDILLTGNNGKEGAAGLIKEIDEICKKEKCTFWVNEEKYNSNEYSLYNKELHKYVTDNYIPREGMIGITIYKNY